MRMGIAKLFCFVLSTIIFEMACAQSPIEPIELGKDLPPERQPSSCVRDFGQDELGKWIGDVVSKACTRGDADSLLGVFLIATSQGYPDWATLDRALAAGQNSPDVLWTVTVLSQCRFPFETSECLRALKAAKRLTEVDPNNAMAWLTLAYASYIAVNDENYFSALERVATSPHVHDYAFDTHKAALMDVDRVALSGAIGAHSSQSKLTVALAYELPNTHLVNWLKSGCGLDAEEKNEVIEVACSKASEILKRGDSAATLTADPEKAAAIQKVYDLIRSNQSDELMKAYLTSKSEAEMAAKVSDVNH